MSVTPADFLNFAISEHKNADGSEFNFRNSASRAYYAAFHCCYAERSRCPGLNNDDVKGSHDRLYALFETMPSSEENCTLKKMAYVAKIMKTVRHKADYYLNAAFSKNDSEQQIKDAQKVFSHWKKIQN